MYGVERRLAHRRSHVRRAAQGFAIRGNEWVAGVSQGLDIVRCWSRRFASSTVKLLDFTKWLNRTATRMSDYHPVDSRHGTRSMESSTDCPC
jgi:hypothetical protein